MCILVIVDDLSSYLWVTPLKRNKGQEVLDAFKNIFDATQRFPSMLTTDAGSEFCANIFQAFLNARNIFHHIAKPPLKAQASFMSVHACMHRIMYEFLFLAC